MQNTCQLRHVLFFFLNLLVKVSVLLQIIVEISKLCGIVFRLIPPCSGIYATLGSILWIYVALAERVVLCVLHVLCLYYYNQLVGKLSIPSSILNLPYFVPVCYNYLLWVMLSICKYLSYYCWCTALIYYAQLLLVLLYHKFAYAV